MRTRGWLGTTLIVGVLCFGRLSRADEPFVDPYTASSGSGAWVLRVEPTAPGGAGAATYRMSKDGVAAYDVRLDFTFRECVVSDSGVAVGYAYDTGYMGWGGDVIVAAIGPDGAVLNTEEHERDGPALGITPPPPGDPRGMGVVADAANQRVIVRLSRSLRNEKSPTAWRIYSLKDGLFIAEQALAPPHRELGFSREIAVRLIPGTGLAAVHWFVYEQGVMSAVFQLVEPEGNVAWSRRIDREYAGLGERWNWPDLHERGVQQIEPEGPSRFSIVSYGEGQRTHYQVQTDAAGARTVRETGKEGDKPTEHDPDAPNLKLTNRVLNPLGEITLGDPAPTSPIDGITGLCFDGRGRMGWVRWAPSGDGAPRFVLVDREGKVAVDVPLELPKDKSASLPLTCWLNGDRWLITQTTYDENRAAQARAWFLEVATGRLSVVEGFSGAHLKRVCGTPDGGFVVLGSLHGDYTIRDQVARYDPEGRQLDSKTEPGYGHGDSIQDIAVLTDGTLALLTGVADRSEIKLRRPGADEPGIWRLSEVVADAAGPGMSYYAGIRADRDGGVVAYDSANENLLHRIDKAGKRSESVHVRGPKNEQFRLYAQFAVDPDGRIWASDGTRLFRVGPDGKADVALGGPAEGAMATPVAVTIDKEGLIYAVEKGTAAVHVFSAEGKPIRVMRPDPADTPTQDALAWIKVDEDGRLRYRMTYEGPVITFGPDGSKLDVSMPPAAWRPEAAFAWTPVGSGWERTPSTVRRRVADGADPRVIAHRPSGAWIVSIVDAAAAPDGSLALLCARRDPSAMFSPRHGPMNLCLYAADGGVIADVPIAGPSYFHRLCWDGRRLVMPDEKGLTVFSVPPTAKADRYEFPGERKFWHTMLRPDGTIAAWASSSRSIQRWAVPE